MMNKKKKIPWYQQQQKMEKGLSKRRIFVKKALLKNAVLGLFPRPYAVEYQTLNISIHVMADWSKTKVLCFLRWAGL